MFASKDIFLTPPSGGYSIARSVRTRQSASAYFNRTAGVAPTSNQKGTFSFWFKRGSLATGSEQWLFAGGSNSMGCGLPTNNVMFIEYFGALYLYTTQVFRDPSAWYHMVFAIDTTQATAANRAKLYINGVQVTSFTTEQYPSQNATFNWMASGQACYINQIYAGGRYFDGYMAEFNYIDGQQLTPSSFGETDSITGVWKAKKYGGTYGTNGFYLNFSDNSNNTAATIGKDYSGNGNNWTPNNISVTSGVTYDSMTDVPTLTSATAANYCVFNPLDIFVSGSGTTRTFADGNLNVTLTNPAGVYSAARGTLYIDTSVKSYFEVNFASGSSGGVGVCNQSSSWASGGFDANAWGYITNGSKSSNGNTSYGSSYSSGSSTIIGVAVNGGNIWFALNGTWQASGDPATGANPAFTNVTGPITVLVANSAGSTTNSYNLNCGQRPFTYTPPTGFVALNTYNLPASTIKNGAAYMAATLYTGNASTQTITNTVNGISFASELVWIKDRSAARQNSLSDIVRGTNKELFSDSTDADTSPATPVVTAFNSNGFTIGANGTVNASGESFVAWQWKAGGSGSSNTSGSITSTVSAGATQGFSVVTYTGTGANATVGHGLGVTPSMYIVKRRTGGIGNWAVWHTGLSNTTTSYILLDSTSAQSTSTSLWGSTAATSTTLGIGTSVTTNNSTDTYVAYCFAAVAGYSAFGSYTGNGSTDGPFVYLGFRPRLIIIKETTPNARNWVMYDSSRNTYNQVGLTLFPNLSNAEDAGSGIYNQMDFLSNGVKFRAGTNSEPTNESGATYIYAAFAEVGFKSALAR